MAVFKLLLTNVSTQIQNTQWKVKTMKSLEFLVTICLGGGDGGDVCVDVDVTDEEFELLKECCREGSDIEGYDGLENYMKG